MNFQGILRFQIVVWLGSLVNLGVLWLLHGLLKIPVTIAGACAIEIAILHNFTWFYFRTWGDRVYRTRVDFFRRLVRYNLITASIDFIINWGTLWSLNHFFHVHYLLADMAGMVIGPFFKFIANEFLIFQKSK